MNRWKDEVMQGEEHNSAVLREDVDDRATLREAALRDINEYIALVGDVKDAYGLLLVAVEVVCDDGFIDTSAIADATAKVQRVEVSDAEDEKYEAMRQSMISLLNGERTTST